MIKWHDGPPPHAGWWWTMAIADVKLWRWWNGRRWSKPVPPRDTAESAENRSRLPTSYLARDIKWSTYWPRNARVPRVDPR